MTSGQAPCSGARRRDKALDVGSATIHGDEVAVNAVANMQAVHAILKIIGTPNLTNLKRLIRQDSSLSLLSVWFGADRASDA